MDPWDWLVGLFDWLVGNGPGLRCWLFVLLAALVIWWLYVPYFQV